MNLDERLRVAAETQHSLLTTVQMAELGATSHARQHRLQGSDWERLTSRVIRLSGSARTPEQRLLAAVLDAGPGAVLSHTTAAAFWGIPGFDLRELHVTQPRQGSRRGSTLAKLHVVRALHPGHVTVLRSIPISRPARVIFELAATVHPQRAERACNNAWSRRLLCGQQLWAMLQDWAEHGRNGTTAMREILEQRPPGWIPPASNLEHRFETVLAQNGLPPMERQVDSGGTDWVGRVDYRDRRLPLVVEVLSELHHTALLDRVADAARFDELTSAGFTVVIVWDSELWHHPRTVAARVRDARAELLDSGASSHGHSRQKPRQKP